MASSYTQVIYPLTKEIAMRYKQLTCEERYQISASLEAGKTQKEIADQLNRSPATISRELKRNTAPEGYKPQKANRIAENRRKNKQTSVISPETWQMIRQKIEQDWSPEQINGWLKKENLPTVSHEWIYQFIRWNKQKGGDLFRHLRCKKKRKKRYGVTNNRGMIKNRVSIEERPEIVANRERIGDWEIDTVLGGQKKAQVLVTCVERKSRLTVIAIAKDKTAEAVTEALIKALTPYKEIVLTLTFDNGREFAYHEKISAALEATSYFAHPYHSWERGANENTNGLIRQYAPKGSDFNGLTNQEVEFMMEQLNNRPRKCLDFETPNQIIQKVYQEIALAS